MAFRRLVSKLKTSAELEKAKEVGVRARVEGTVVGVDALEYTEEGYILTWLLDNGEMRGYLLSEHIARKLRDDLEQLERPSLKDTETKLKKATSEFIGFLISKDYEYEENMEILGFKVDILKQKKGRLDVPEAFIFINGVLDKPAVITFSEKFNNEELNKNKITLIIAASAATHEAIKAARDRVQVYDLNSGEKGEGFDSVELEHYCEKSLEITFKHL
ncbi:MAG: hypothetical protein Q6362_003215 [Candidatus Wukongarchaeota archaeon]|nr:hypothetical protein [Candidatus Wukongarchaeota archaeon]MDO8128442.1 hypothetical protein [Candidatus Wukongarchaeota archaeon]